MDKKSKFWGNDFIFLEEEEEETEGERSDAIPNNLWIAKRASR